MNKQSFVGGHKVCESIKVFKMYTAILGGRSIFQVMVEVESTKEQFFHIGFPSITVSAIHKKG